MIRIYDWANNLVSPETFETFEDAHDRLDEIILRVYGKLEEEALDAQRDEYWIKY